MTDIVRPALLPLTAHQALMRAAKVDAERASDIRQALSEAGYAITSSSDRHLHHMQVAVENFERLGPSRYRGDISMIIPVWGRLIVTRVVLGYAPGNGPWHIEWPRRHREGANPGWSQDWVTVARMSGALARRTMLALVEAAAAAGYIDQDQVRMAKEQRKRPTG